MYVSPSLYLEKKKAMDNMSGKTGNNNYLNLIFLQLAFVKMYVPYSVAIKFCH